ncbi:MAG: glycosyltransferase family 4 protein, partial [Akkermansiaceae bacterium]
KKHYGLLPERFTVLPPWLKKPITQQSDRQETRQRLCAEMGIRQDEPLLLFVASNYRCKGLDRAIQGVAKSQAKPINLVVCGDDKTADMKQLASESGVNIVFAGARDDVDEWMLAADMLIHPARMEAAGMVLTEALVQGLPVLCTENCGYAKHIADAGSVVVSEDAGAQTIAQGIDKILAERVKLSAAALDWVDSENRFQTGETILNTMRQSTTI